MQEYTGLLDFLDVFYNLIEGKNGKNTEFQVFDSTNIKYLQ